MHGRRRWIAAGLGIAAAAALAPATASAAGLIAAYDYYATGKGFEIGLKNAQTGANIASRRRSTRPMTSCTRRSRPTVATSRSRA
jgi:hypothetical protein